MYIIASAPSTGLPERIPRWGEFQTGLRRKAVPAGRESLDGLFRVQAELSTCNCKFVNWTGSAQRGEIVFDRETRPQGRYCGADVDL